MHRDLRRDHGIVTPTHMMAMGGKLHRANSGLSRRLYDAFEQSRELAIADALGRSLGEPLHVRGGSRVPSRGGEVYAMAVSARQVAPTPIEAGDLTITATVDIRFAIGR